MKLFLDLCKMCKAKLLYEAFLIYKNKNLIKLHFTCPSYPKDVFCSPK